MGREREREREYRNGKILSHKPELKISQVQVFHPAREVTHSDTVSWPVTSDMIPLIGRATPAGKASSLASSEAICFFAWLWEYHAIGMELELLKISEMQLYMFARIGWRQYSNGTRFWVVPKIKEAHGWFGLVVANQSRWNKKWLRQSSQMGHGQNTNRVTLANIVPVYDTRWTR